MAWTAPYTAVAGERITAEDFNTHVRDNLNMLAPAKATAGMGWFTSQGPNNIRQLQPASTPVGPPVANGASIDTTDLHSDVMVTCNRGYILLMDWKLDRTGSAGARANWHMRVRLDGGTVIETWDRVFSEQGGQGPYSSSWAETVLAPAGSHGLRLAYRTVWDAAANGDSMTLSDYRLHIIPF